MQIPAQQLPAALAKNIAPVYLISGDEPLQLGEAADAVRQAVKAAGYQIREVYSVETGFNWGELSYAASALSIFSEQKLLDLRLPSGKPGREGGKALVEYCQNLPDQTILLISAGKIASESLKARWYQAVDKIGVTVRVWPLEGKDLLGWLDRRLQNRGLSCDRSSLQLLASRVEGNLLAAAQEIEKLYVLNGPGRINSQTIQAQVVDNSRYNVFKLVDAMLVGKPLRVMKILQGIRAEGAVEPLVIWAITKEIRLLANIKALMDAGKSIDGAFKTLKIWSQKKTALSLAAKRLNRKEIDRILLLSGQADRQTKGQESGDAWETILRLCLLTAGLNGLHR